MKNKIKTNCFLLKKQPYSESSILMQVFSDTLGLISVLAKGMHKQKAHQDFLLNVLNEYEMVITEASPSGMHILTELSLLSEYPTDLPLETWFTAQAGAEFLTKLLIPEGEIPLFYQTLSRYLTYQKGVSVNSIAIFWRFLLSIFTQLGIPIDLTKCSGCHKDLKVQAGYTADSGQLVCDDCFLTLRASYLLDPETSNLLTLLPVIGNYLNDLEISKDSIRQLNHFFMQYVSLQFHKTIYLKSLEFYK
jgi:DNA repair protein RecO